MITKTLIATAAALFLSGAAFAQQEGLVNVNVTDTNILNDLQLSAPINVQVPVGIAAAVCGIDANILAQQAKGNQNYSCDATNNTQAFSQLVSRQQQDGGGQGGGQGNGQGQGSGG